MSKDHRYRSFLAVKRANDNTTPLTTAPIAPSLAGWVPYPNDYAPSPGACALMQARWRGIAVAWLAAQHDTERA